MAETAKRPANNKPAAKGPSPAVATPHVGGAGSIASPSNAVADQALNATFGSRVRVETNVPRSTWEGTLYAACTQTGLVALAVAGTNAAGPSTYRLIPLSSLTSFDVLAQAPTPTQPRPVPPAVNTAALLARANQAVDRAKERAAKTNKGVDRKVQDLFDAMDKQFTARWKGKDIIVMERVVVRGPGYRSEDCKVITKDGEGLLGRVRKVLENEKNRAMKRDNRASTTSPPVPNNGNAAGASAVRPAVPTIVPAVPVPLACGRAVDGNVQDWEDG